MSTETIESFSHAYVDTVSQAVCGRRRSVPTRAAVQADLKVAFPLLTWWTLFTWALWIIRQIRARLKQSQT